MFDPAIFQSSNVDRDDRRYQIRTMKTMNLGDAKARLAELVRAVSSGTEPEIVIALDGVPAVRIVPYGNAPRRTLGIDVGLVSWPSDFDEPNKQIAELFGGRALVKLLLDRHASIGRGRTGKDCHDMPEKRLKIPRSSHAGSV